MSYKSLESLNELKQERKAIVLQEIGSKECSDTEEEKVTKANEETFNFEAFMLKHPEYSYENLTNFTNEELDELETIITERLGTGPRGKKMRISTKGCIFLTLMYYSTYIPLQTLSGIVSVPVPTLERIIRKVTLAFFPIFIDHFIPKTLPLCNTHFKNYPAAVGAADSSTIEFYRPLHMGT